MANRRWIAVLVSGALLVSVAGCGSDDDAASGAQGADGTAKETVKIGHLGNLTGAAASLGVPYKKGLDLGVAEINASGFLDNAQLQVLTEDTGSTPTNAVTIFNEFERDGIPVTVSDGISPLALAVGPLANETKTVFLTGAGSGTPAEDFEFHLSDVKTQYEQLGPYLAKEGGPRVAAIVGTDNPAFQVLTANLKSGLEKAGASIVATESIEAADTNFSSVLTNIKKANPDVVFISTLAPTAGNILAQMDKMGGFQDVLKTVQSGVSRVVSEVAGPAAQGVVLRPAWAPGAPGSEEFVAAYKKANNNELPDTNAAFGYQSAWVIATAVKMILQAGEKVTGESLRSRIPAASQSPDMKEHGIIPDLVIPASGATTWPGVLSTFGKSGDIEAITS